MHLNLCSGSFGHGCVFVCMPTHNYAICAHSLLIFYRLPVFGLHNKPSDLGEAKTAYLVLFLFQNKNIIEKISSFFAARVQCVCFHAHWIKPLQHQHGVLQLAGRRIRTERRRERRTGGAGGEKDGNQRLRNWITRAFSHYHLAVFYGPPVRDDVPMTPHNTQTYYSILPRWNSCK